MKKLITAMLAIAMSLVCVLPAGAANVKLADPSAMIAVASEKTGVAADLNAAVEANIITSSEKKLIEGNGVITRAVAWRVLLPAFGIYPYPASCYPDIAPADQCVNDYANARCAAITLGLATKEQNPIQVMSASEFEALVAALRKGVSLPHIETGIPYVDSVESWDRNTYEGRNSMIEAYAKIPAAWLKDFDEQGWKFQFVLPTDYNADQVIANHSVAGQTRYKDKVVLIGRSLPTVSIHEMVHYIVKRAGVSNDQMNKIAAVEAAAMKETLGAYSQTKGTEYIPEFVAYWAMNPGQHNALKNIAPQSSALAEQLMAWNAAV